jgi:manganese/iron transport system substrate-binding protein
MRQQLNGLLITLTVLSILLSAAGGCGPAAATGTPGGAAHVDTLPSLSPAPLGAGEKLRVVATTSIVADVVGNVGGDQIELTALMPLGADPHAFEPTPQDVAAVSNAHVVFASGAGLEAFLEPLLESAGAAGKAVQLSQGIELLQVEGAHAGEHAGGDPHTWTDPHNVMVWTRDIAQALSALDPDNAATYAANAEAYGAALRELDAWVREQVAQVPEAQRQIVTDHLLFAYFAGRYGFTQVGALVPSYSTLAEPSAKELAELEDAIRNSGVKAIFAGNTVNPNLARRVAEDTGTHIVFLYTGSLTAKGGEADSYIDYVRYNVNAIVNALK